jgi:hypothetical protein
MLIFRRILNFNQVSTFQPILNVDTTLLCRMGGQPKDQDVNYVALQGNVVRGLSLAT